MEWEAQRHLPRSLDWSIRLFAFADWLARGTFGYPPYDYGRSDRQSHLTSPQTLQSAQSIGLSNNLEFLPENYTKHSTEFSHM